MTEAPDQHEQHEQHERLAEAQHVLFLCTGNSARSLLAECALERWGAPRFRAHSAGSQPKTAPHPTTLRLLRGLDYDTRNLRSKSWDEFARDDAPKLDFVITVCDNARGEACPIWPGRPLTAHWGVEDPAAFEGSPEAELACFRRVYLELESRIRRFLRLPIGSLRSSEGLDPTSLQESLDAIGRGTLPAGAAAPQRSGPSR